MRFVAAEVQTLKGVGGKFQLNFGNDASQLQYWSTTWARESTDPALDTHVELQMHHKRIPHNALQLLLPHQHNLSLTRARCCTSSEDLWIALYKHMTAERCRTSAVLAAALAVRSVFSCKANICLYNGFLLYSIISEEHRVSSPHCVDV